MIGRNPGYNQFSIFQYYREVYLSEDLYEVPTCGPNLRHYTSLEQFLHQGPGDEGYFTADVQKTVHRLPINQNFQVNIAGVFTVSPYTISVLDKRGTRVRSLRETTLITISDDMALFATVKTTTVANLAGLSRAHLSIRTAIIPISRRDWRVIAKNGGAHHGILGLAQPLIQLLHGLRQQFYPGILGSLSDYGTHRALVHYTNRFTGSSVDRLKNGLYPLGHSKSTVQVGLVQGLYLVN